ncbi:MAG TPA: hypothetical protein VG796_14810 [Verrucomicrobiales bacterium]|nr:hypothetical protein [Verrucomicrobiales bacterium]
MPVPPKIYPKELYLKCERGQWILTTPKGKHDMRLVLVWNAAHPLAHIVEAAKTHAAKYPEGAELTIIRGKGCGNVEIIEFPPHWLPA